MTFCPYKSRIGNTPEERKKFVENSLGFQLGEPVGNFAWLRPDDPDRMVAVFYNSCQGNYLDTGTTFFCMCVGGSERPYLELARRIENKDADPLLKSSYMVQYIGTNINKCRHLFPDAPKERASEWNLMDCCWKRGGQQKEEILYYEQEVPGKSLQQCRLESKREICHVFRQLLDFAASLENSDRSLFDKYARILGSASLKETDGEPQLKFKVSLERTGYGDILDNRFASPPAPELWDAEHGGYFEKEQDDLEHPKKFLTSEEVAILETLTPKQRSIAVWSWIARTCRMGFEGLPPPNFNIIQQRCIMATQSIQLARSLHRMAACYIPP